MSQRREEPSAKDGDDPVALAALVIALVSFVVSFCQLLQAYFATSDGYRRCKEPALGPWARLTRTPFHFTELRYETIYSVPAIELSSVRTGKDSEPSVVKQRLDGPHHKVVQLPPVNNQRMLAMVSDGYSSDANPKIINLGSLGQLREGQDTKETRAQTTDVENGQPSLSENIPEQPRHWPIFRSLSIRAKYDDFVLSALVTNLTQKDGPERPILNHFKANPKSHATWIAFLREMSLTTAAPSDLPVAELSTLPCTDAVLQVAERSWDFTSGVLKPRALCTVSTIVILAVRMDMDWYRLKAGQPGMEAFGNGFALTSSMDPDGHLFRFTFDDKFRHKTSDIVPSQNSDKMICGIIPANIIDEEIKLVTDDGELKQPDSIASALRLSDDARRSLEMSLGQTNHLQKAAANDLIAFLSPLVTLPGIDSYGVKFPAWFGFGKGNRHTVFDNRTYELLYSRIDERARDLKNATLQHRKFLRRSVTEVETFFRRGANNEPQWLHLDTCTTVEEKVSFVRNVHSAHKRITEFLNWGEGIVLGLFDAYVITSAEFISKKNPGQKSFNWRDRGLNQGLGGKMILALINDDEARRHMDLLVEYLDDPFIEKLTTRAWKEEYKGGLDKSDLEAVWLLVLLRGMLWDMSCRCLPPGKPIPSSTYYNTTRAWIE